MKITTNNVERRFISGYEIPEKILKEFDYIDDPMSDNSFFKYKGNYYNLADFMPIGRYAQGFQAIMTETYFSGIVIKVSDDGEGLIVGHAFS